MRPPGAYLLHSSDRHELDSHRVKNLVTAEGFTAQPEAVAWSESDERGRVLGLYTPGGLVASLRLEVLHRPEELTPRLDYEFLGHQVTFPCGLLGKAATAREFRGQGLNTYLRYLAYEILHGEGVRFVVGTVVPGAPRLHLLRELGYEFRENPHGWRRFGYRSQGPTLVAMLDLQEKYRHVRETLGPLVAGPRAQYPIAFPLS
jgi:hypothetical protein